MLHDLQSSSMEDRRCPKPGVSIVLISPQFRKAGRLAGVTRQTDCIIAYLHMPQALELVYIDRC